MTSELSDVLAFCIMKLRQRLFVSWPVGGFINSAFKIRLEILAFLYFLGIQNASLIVCPVCPVQCRFIVSQLVSLPSVMFPNSE